MVLNTKVEQVENNLTLSGKKCIFIIILFNIFKHFNIFKIFKESLD